MKGLSFIIPNILIVLFLPGIHHVDMPAPFFFNKPKTQCDDSISESLTKQKITELEDRFKQTRLETEKLCYRAIITKGLYLPMKWRRAGQAGGKVGGSVLIAGGTEWNKAKTQKYWLNTSVVFQDGKWKLGPNLPEPIAYSMFAYDSDGLYIAGGYISETSPSNGVYRLVSLSKGWEPLPKLPMRLGYGSGAILNRKFYVACGSNESGMSNKVWVLDLGNPNSKWEQCKPLPGVGRILPSMVACGKYLYLLGGLAKISPLSPLKDAYQYDPSKNQWKQLSDLPLKGYAWVSQPVDDNHLIITGRAYGKVDRGVWILNLKTMSMKKVGDDIVPAATAPLINVGNKQWWLIGGEPDAYKNRTNVVSVINIKENSNCN